MSSSNKPKNVFIYTGEGQKNLFKNAAGNLLNVLHRDRYLVNELTNSLVLENSWKENIALLVVLCDTIDESTAEIFKNYLAEDGKLLVFCCNFIMPEMGLTYTPSTSTHSCVGVNYNGEVDVNVYHGKVSYNFENAEVLASSSDNEPVIMKKTIGNGGILVISAVHLILDSDVLSTNGNKVPDNKKDRLIVLENIIGKEFGLDLASSPALSSAFLLLKEAGLLQKYNARKVAVKKGAQPDTVPLVVENEVADLPQFDKQSYFSNLKTKNLGHITIYIPLTKSAIVLAQHLSDLEGAVVIANSRLCEWNHCLIGHKGFATFTTHVTFSLSSLLGQRISLLQLMITLAVVLAIRKIPGYKKFDLRLKWPNELYYGNSRKIGSATVQTVVQSKLVHAYITIDINIANQSLSYGINSWVRSRNEAKRDLLPSDVKTANQFLTHSIDGCIRDHNNAKGDSLLLLTSEVVIARTLTEFELLLDNFTRFGSVPFLSLYKLYWLHSNQRVVLSSFKKMATVKGIDVYGYLIIKTDDGMVGRLHPDDSIGKIRIVPKL